MITIETITRLDYASLMNRSKRDLALLVLWLIKRIESGPTPLAPDAEQGTEIDDDQTAQLNYGRQADSLRGILMWEVLNYIESEMQDILYSEIGCFCICFILVPICLACAFLWAVK